MTKIQILTKNIVKNTYYLRVSEISSYITFFGINWCEKYFVNKKNLTIEVK